jgi:hypothetical protein
MTAELAAGKTAAKGADSIEAPVAEPAAGMTAAEGADSSEAPATLTAETVKV